MNLLYTNWAAFIHNHADQIWACDFSQVSGHFFRSLFAFVIVELGSRRVVHIGEISHPTDAWMAQSARQCRSVSGSLLIDRI